MAVKLLLSIAAVFFLNYVTAQTSNSLTNQWYNLNASIDASGNLVETYSVSTKGTFVPTLQYSGPTLLFHSSSPFNQFLVKWSTIQISNQDTLIITGSGVCVGGSGCSTSIKRTITISDQGFSFLDLANNAGSSISVSSYENWYNFINGPPANVESVFSQSIKHEAAAFIPHWQFKAPAVILQTGTTFASLISNLSDSSMTKSQLPTYPAFMDLNNDGNAVPRFSYGVGGWLFDFHSIYSRNPAVALPWSNGGTLRLAYHIILGSNVTTTQTVDSTDPTSATVTTQFLWQKFGRPGLLATPEMQTNYDNAGLTTFDNWRQYTWVQSTPNFYFEFPCGDGDQICSSLRCNRNVWADDVGNDNDAWFNSWFQTLRTAYGWYIYGQRINNTRVMQQAQGVVNLALQAPNDQGAFPSIFWLGGNPSKIQMKLESGDTCTPTGTFQQTDLPGDDYYHFAVVSGDPATVCQQACCNDVQCLAWAVMVKETATFTNCPVGSTCCWLKSGVPARVGNSNVTSGTMTHSENICTVKTLNGVDMPGQDYTNFEVSGSDPVSACSQACCADLKCAAWVLANPQQISLPGCNQGSACCWLKTAAPAQSACSYCTAGIATRDLVLNWVDDSGWAGLCHVLPPDTVPLNCMEFFHSFDIAWTGTWLLHWLRRLTPNDTRILPFLKVLGDFFVQKQNTSTGVIPSWYSIETGTPASPYFKDTNAETAGVALFLAELYNATGDKTYLTSAQSALKYLENVILPTRKWWDFETYLSCSTKPFNFYDPYTRQTPQNTLSKIQAAYAFLKMYQITADSHYLRVGTQVVDYTSLIQTHWDHPNLTPHLLGGFSSQNTDAEWSDARQAHAADMYFGYYRETWNLEYLERGVAAMRASFTISPYENWAHEGGGTGDVPGAISSFHWGQGSGLATVEIHYDWLKDAYININQGRRHAVGVNGCTLSNLQVDTTNYQISFTVKTTYSWQNFIVAIDTGSTVGPWSITVNAVKLSGSFTNTQLLNGVAVPPNIL